MFTIRLRVPLAHQHTRLHTSCPADHTGHGAVVSAITHREFTDAGSIRTIIPGRASDDDVEVFREVAAAGDFEHLW
jgi:hypothetical protein